MDMEPSNKTIQLTSDVTVRLIQQMGGDAMVVAAAKVSVDGETALKFASEPAEASYGLISYLMKHRHGTPFEHGSLTLFVHAPIFVWREWHRHRVGFSYNETSGRYKELEPIFWIPRRDRKLAPINGFKPARPQFEPVVKDDEFAAIVNALADSYQQSYQTYQSLLSSGVAKEVARACLPVSIYSSCWVTTNPRALMHFLSLRTHDETAKFISYPQAEIEEAARVAEDIFAKHWPLTYKAWQVNGRVAP